MNKTKESWEEEILKLLNDKRTGLKASSDSNKTRYNILGIVEDALKSQESKYLKVWLEILKGSGIDDYGEVYINKDDCLKILKNNNIEL